MRPDPGSSISLGAEYRTAGMDESPQEIAAESLRLARERIGPATEKLLAKPESQALLLSRLRAGADLTDAILWLVHQEAATDRALANEFVAFFLTDTLKMAKPVIAPGLRRYLDSGDLVQSVLGDLWNELSELRFEGRAQFLAFLSQRLHWKASDERRRLRRGKRREDLRSAATPEELDLVAGGRSPASLAGIREDLDMLVLRLLRLPERDRLLLRLHLSGESIAAIARATGLNEEAAKKALQRAIQKARRLR
jgi:RNA polymerase sigma factor (sigma-70 family)